MKLQIQLNENNPKEKAAAEIIRSFGQRSGVPKQALIDAVLNLGNESVKVEAPAPAAPVKRKSKPNLQALT